ncbi:DUF4394 domain-containing protein [Paraconexibacter algicola]|uniref:DUF4394 domain-containing protein n=1 Tax=Paraconexibacter algicola TaxID=2133960 RepID=A0A2T4UH73_9ACTN|nr:DUF4394 domain-containing protein [Paraconexibacter algicola]PTL58590.1 hypothetical protein C7Y72_02405 [Paraconexibacter algicola]
MSALRRAVLSSLALLAVVAGSAQAAPGDRAFALVAGPQLLVFDPAAPQATTAVSVTGVAAGETLVGIDVRPLNGTLLGLGVNAGANTGTLYAIAPQTGVARAIGTVGNVLPVQANGATPVDLPDPATVQYGVDVNPAADRVRVTAGTLNFRVNPNTGLNIDGDFGGAPGSAAGANPDGPINGASTSVSETAYTGSRITNAGITTQYTIDAGTRAIAIQNPPNAGTQTGSRPVTLGGAPLNFAASVGFDIDPAVSAASNGAAASGVAYATLTVAGETGLYRIDLPTGSATLVGRLGDGTRPAIGLALQRDEADGYPVVGLSSDGTTLTRITSTAPGSALATGILGMASGETMVAVAWRPADGLLYGIGVNPLADTGTLYRVDPVSGAVTVIGGTSVLSWITAAGAAVDLASPAVTGYGMDVDPTTDRVRLTASAGLNARVNPITGFPVDGDAANPGVQPDPGSAGVSGASFANPFAGAATTTLYALKAGNDTLAVQLPPNSGTQVAERPVTVGGAPLDFSVLSSLDLPPDATVTAAGGESSGEALAALTSGGTSRLYRLRLADGAATEIGPFGVPLRSLAVGAAAPDQTAPAAPVITAPVADAALTATPAVTGTGEPGATLTVTEGPLTLCSTVVGGDGGWSCTPTALAVGAHTIAVAQADRRGNVSATATRSFSIVAPITPPGTAPAPPTPTPTAPATCRTRTVTVRLPKGTRRATVTLAGKRARVRRVKGRLVATLRLPATRSGRVTVRVTRTTKGGKRRVKTTRYATCKRA